MMRGRGRSGWGALTGTLGAVAIACMVPPSPVWGASQGKTSQGEPFVTGGNVDQERTAMRSERKKFNLWIQTGSSSAGGVSPDAEVRISTAAGDTVLDTRMRGPWLFVNLGLGQYAVAVSAAGATRTRRTFIHRGDHTEMVFYFDSPPAQPAVTPAAAPR